MTITNTQAEGIRNVLADVVHRLSLESETPAPERADVPSASVSAGDENGAADE